MGEIANVGLSETQATEKGIEIISGVLPHQRMVELATGATDAWLNYGNLRAKMGRADCCR